MSAVALLDLGTRTLHLPSTTHGVARCGADLTGAGPWACGPAPVLGRVARWHCLWCYPEGLPDGG